MTAGAPVLRSWFAAMDGPAPERVLGLLADDFSMSVVSWPARRPGIRLLG